MKMSKIPILSNSQNKRNVPKKPSKISPEMNGEQMFLLAKIEILEQENNILKEEKIVAMQKLAAAEDSISKLKAEILVMKEIKKDETIKQQVEMAKVRKFRNKSFNFARKIQNITDLKLAETEKTSKDEIASIKEATDKKVKEAEKKNKELLEEKHKEMRVWKDKFEQLDNIVQDFNEEVKKEWPVLSDDETTTMLSHIASKRDQVQFSKLQARGNGLEKAIIEFRSGFSMLAILELNNDRGIEFKNPQIRRVPLEGEPWAQNGKRR